ncbi:isoleucine--tRNA ligase [Candidatus Roizmanbacteria bacterium]|nr:isoleucine--tRNA ligase [Candidatus Roizmanbacteria bacterium]
MLKPVEQVIDFPAMEKRWLDSWRKNDIVRKYLHKNDHAVKRFSFLDGPITANNPMGVHHAWGRTYKDLWQKFHNLQGYRQRFQNGFDCQGLWVEVEVEKELGLRTKKDIENLVAGDRKASIAKFVELCKARVRKFSAIQTEQTKRLGNFMDWDLSYFTMSDENNYMIWHFLKTCYTNGWIYKGHESVPWCPRCETAISQHEMLTEDYKEVVHESIYFALPIVSHPKEFLLVWTTTPWTIPANIAVAVDEKLVYALVQVGNGCQYWVGKASVGRVFEGQTYKIIKTVKGKELVGLYYQGPFDHLDPVKKTGKAHKKTFHIVIATDKKILPISEEEGTGLVHTAVSAGVEDFKLGKKYSLPMIPVIGDNADYLPGLGEFSGKNAKKHPRLILDYLVDQDKKNGRHFVYKIHNYKHRYPACWRCKTELVWKVADEWYIAMDKPAKLKKGKTLRQRMMAVSKKIRWMPEFGLDRELDWLKNMHDWLISKKNRYWGLSLPIYECKKCGSFEVLGSNEELKERAVSGWAQFEGKSPHKPYVDDVQIACQKCRQPVSRIADVGNPWLDAGIVPYSTISEGNSGEPLYRKNKNEWKKWFPVDFITESFPGQFKNWFYALIAESTVLENTNPFKTVLGFATLLGEDGRPMHKSWGNAVEFNEGADKIGVDVIRWMFARQNPSENMLFGYKKADEVRRQFYLMLWNVYKFFSDYAVLEKPSLKPPVAKNVDSDNILDAWIVSRFVFLVSFSQSALTNFNAKEVALETERFVGDVSTWYIRRSRDRIWVNSENEADKKNFYQTLYFILVNLAIILSPFMPFISEEIYVSLANDAAESVHLTAWPAVPQSRRDEDLEKDMALIREMAEAGHKARKELKIKVRQPLAKAVVHLPSPARFEKKVFLNVYKRLLAGELNVKEIQIESDVTAELRVQLEDTITPELAAEGRLRDTVREIQGLRKTHGVRPDQYIRVIVPAEFKKHGDYIKKRVLASHLEFGDSVKVIV